jgi:putative tricarboxylic transport membrane protein
MKSVEQKIGIGLIVIALFVLAEAVRLTMKYQMTHHVGPSTFPLIVGGCLLFSGMYFVFSKTWKMKTIALKLPEGKTRRVMINTMFVMIGYSIIMPLVGYPISTLAASITLFQVMSSYSLKINILAGFIVTAILYLVFSQIVYVPFPQGIFIHLV